LLFDIPKNLSDIFLKRIIIGKYTLGCIPCCNNNFSFNYLMIHEILDINLNLIESYTAEITNNIYYFSWLATKQVLVEENIDSYRYKKIIKLSLIFIENIRCLDNNNIFLYYKY
jgi:hypothetical protein